MIALSPIAYGCRTARCRNILGAFGPLRSHCAEHADGDQILAVTDGAEVFHVALSLNFMRGFRGQA